jgi:crotonobetainyl-CoA:carnitine CoA-transferase CaiB-like acyl-CoA transferase
MPVEPSPALAGVRVVEVSAGISVVGAGLAACLPGGVCRDLGADVARVCSNERSTLDEGVEFERSWNRGKELVAVDTEHVAETAARLARDADVLFVMGDPEWLERGGLHYRDLASANPGLVCVRIRPSYHAAGAMADFELLVHARTGLLTQIRGHRPGPVFCDLGVASAGAALCATAGALACLYEREATGRGGWAETSLQDGMHALLPLIIGRVEKPSPSTTSMWQDLGPEVAWSFRGADDRYIQLWFGAKGAYEAFLAHMGDPPSTHGYATDIVSGAITERTVRWRERFATRDSTWWVQNLAGHDFRCEPVLRPGEALLDPHVREVGLSIDVDDPERGTISVLGPVVRARSTRAGDGSARDAAAAPTGRLLTGVHVLDLAAYGAGPMGALTLGELGADVVKVEPTTGDRHRSMEPSFATAHRGKRALTLDLKAPESADVLARLFRWADVVHHSGRVGLAERLGYDETTVRAVNPDVVYSHASGFGSHGPRALLPANDHLIQALSGIEAAAGGGGQAPTHIVAAPIDRANGWMAACAVLAGLYARRRRGGGQSVTSILLGAGMTMKSGAFVAGSKVVEGPLVDPAQTGYGAAYRIYRAADGGWLALAVPDPAAWCRLRAVVDRADLPEQPPRLRMRGDERQPAEDVLEGVFATEGAATWVARLRAAGVPVEAVAEYDRVQFISAILDDPVNRQLGRIATVDWGPRGQLEQTDLPLRFGPLPRRPGRRHLPAIGEHTDEMLDAIGFDVEERAKLAAAGVTTRPPPMAADVTR